jgi:outer membrane protein W
MSAGSFNQTVEMTMKKMMLAAAVLAASGSAFAEGMADKLYVEAGWAWLEIDTGITSSSWLSVDEKDDAPTLLLGYKVNDNFSVEAGVIGSTEASATFAAGAYTLVATGEALTLHTDAKLAAEANEMYTLGGKFSLPVGSDFSAYAKAGLLWWDVDGTVSGDATFRGVRASGKVTLYNSDGSDPYYGVGLNYDINQQVNLRADWLKTEVDDEDLDMYTVAVGYKF